MSSYSRSRSSRRRPLRRRRARRPSRGTVYGAAGRQLWRDVKMLKSFVNTEFKYFDDSTAFTNIPYVDPSGVGTPLIMSLNDIPTGDLGNTRNGMSVRIKSLQHSCTIANTTTSSLPCRVRMIFFLYLRPDGATPTLANLLDLSTDPDPINAFRNLNFKSSFSILKDRVFKMDTTAPQQEQEMRWYKRFNFHTTWTVNNTTGATSTQMKNGLYCLVFTDQAGAVLPRIRCMNRVRFIDN